MEQLPSGYYLDNFRFLMHFVRERYQDLLTANERVFCEDFESASLSAQQLFVRCTTRKGNFFRNDKFSYEEIECLKSAIDELDGIGFCIVNPTQVSEPWLSLATKAELVNQFTVSDKTVRKDVICQEIQQNYNPVQIAEQLPFTLVELCHSDVILVLRLLFFGNLHQDFTDFVLRDLGISPFESYPLDGNHRFFQTRQLVDDVLRAYALQEIADQVLQTGDVCTRQFAEQHLLGIEQEFIHDEPIVRRRYHKVINRVARQLERENEAQLAIRLYQQSSLAPSRERQARLWISEGMIDEGLDLCQRIVESPTTEAEFEFAKSFAYRVGKKHDRIPDWVEKPVRYQYPTDEIFVPANSERRVEHIACDWFNANGDSAFYVENSLIPGVFGLFFWQIIFSPTRGAFFNPLQRGPSDLFTEQFYANRKQAIDDRLADVSQHRLLSECLQVLQQKSGIANYFVDWRVLTEPLLTLALQRIPAAHWRVMFERLLQDLRGNRSGLPDLVVFPGLGGYELVEIKGPGDALQDNQKRWLRYFIAASIPARVVNVLWQS